MTGMGFTLSTTTMNNYFSRDLPYRDRLTSWYEFGDTADPGNLAGGDALTVTGSPEIRRAGAVVDVNNYFTMPYPLAATSLAIVIARRPAAGGIMLLSNFLDSDTASSSYNLAFDAGKASTFLNGVERSLTPPTGSVDGEWCLLAARLFPAARSLWFARQGSVSNPDNVDLSGMTLPPMASRQMNIGRGVTPYSSTSTEISLVTTFTGLLSDSEVPNLISIVRNDWMARKKIFI